MQVNILWEGIEYYSLENCTVKLASNIMDAESAIVGEYAGKIYRVVYHVITNEKGQTTFAVINSTINGQSSRLQLERRRDESWLQNGQLVLGFDDCLDIDIAVSPFTNTLPISRLALTDGEACEIAVIYCNPLTGEVKQVQQQYTKLSSGRYKYENIPKDFEADILVDEYNLVTNYPQLFTRQAMNVLT